MPRSRKQGHPSVFTPAQNRALRESLRGLQSERNLSQTQIGEALGVAQQVAGRLLRREGGFSYQTASRLVRLLGFDGVDAFFVQRGVVGTTPSTAPASTGTEG